jgi:hypothetical protein
VAENSKPAGRQAAASVVERQVTVRVKIKGFVMPDGRVWARELEKK